MGGPTHKRFAVFFAYISLMLLNYFVLMNINYYLQLTIVIPLAKIGALFPDVDHVWKNVKEKTTVNWILNKFIHLTGGTHRSRHTHSWDICIILLILSFILIQKLLSKGFINLIDEHLSFVVLFGFYSGWISHLLSDMLSSSGVYLFFWNKGTIKFVPKKIFGFSFNTGTSWEKFCYSLFGKLDFIFGVLALFFPLILNTEFLLLLYNRFIY